MTGMILIGLKKSFDTIDHDILLKKVRAIGFSNHTVNWFKSYLSDRLFRVSLGNYYSDSSNIICGVPQGSILGTFTCPKDVFLYACLVFQGKHVIEIEQLTGILQISVNGLRIIDFALANKRLNLYFLLLNVK